MRKKWTLARIGLWSAMRTGFTVFAAVGLIMGLFWGVMLALFASLMASAASVRDPGFGPGAVVFLPLFGAALMGGVGAVAALLSALVYNLSAGVFGGLELEIEAGAEPAPVAESGNGAPSPSVFGKIRRVWKQPAVGLARQGVVHPRSSGVGVRMEPAGPDRSVSRADITEQGKE